MKRVVCWLEDYKVMVIITFSLTNISCYKNKNFLKNPNVRVYIRIYNVICL